MLFVGNKFSTFVPLKHQLKNKNSEMKKGIHPENYRLVAFKDMSNDHVFLCRSAVSTKETIEDKFMSRYAKRYDKKGAK